ncbi:acyltransferase family protein, partial [Acidisphaera rubrifaciens]|uniref:acyltransferase family protein n=1 Tax=Acidisphaera rubrifaciens TaxID=50715 RepID=UPI000661FFA1
MRRLDCLDGLRGCLALYVLASHVAPYALVPPSLAWLPGLVSHGQAAVDVFFILSGLVITQSVAAFGGRAAPFLLARAGRTYPVYVACLALTVAVLALPPPAMPWLHAPLDIWPHPPADHGAARLGLHLLMLQGLPPQGVLPDVWVGYLGSAWSLSTEWQFYLAVVLVWPPDAAAARGDAMRRLALAFVALAAVGALWQ